MSWPETLRTALEALRTRRMRSGLTVLGILIGIAAGMLTVGLGQGAQAQVTEQISKLGPNPVSDTHLDVYKRQAYRASWSTVKLASCAALTPNRSVAARPATPREVR